MTFATRTAHLKPEGAYQVLARATQLESAGREIVHFEIGQPDYATFENVSRAGIEAIRAGKTRYTPPAGMTSLREAIAEDSGRRRGIKFNAGEVVVSPGGKPNLFFPTLALVEPGDEVIYPNPGFPTYEAMIKVAGGIPVAVPLLEKNSFSFDLDAFDKLINERTKLIILNSPSNPTGGVIPLEDLKHIAAQAERFNCWVMSDEIYARIKYDGLTAPSIAALPGMKERTIIVDGFSKTYSMTGWRLGYGIMPRELAARVDLLLTHSIGSTAHFTQFAGLEAVTGEQGMVDVMVAEYQRRRDIIVDGLNAIPGFSCQKPQGAFYVFPNIRGTGMSSTDLANLILEKAGVALLPGSSFGDYGEGYLRLSYANSVENIRKGLEKIQAVVKESIKG
ncbi:MAG: pyridoxal phosphate-dependent aminotransferase [Anaerolineales bacterium]|nr:pyridoxal phosphate-dependent aminotransferase [Anaerolineales bacterium]